MAIAQSAGIARLRATVRDLLALTTIPEAWVGREPPAIATDLADLLIESLELDFAFVRLSDPTGRQVAEVTRGSSWKGFPEWLQQHLTVFDHISRKEIVTNVGGVAGSGCGIVIPIGVNGERGLVAAASDRSGFPDQIDQQLLSVAANNGATAFQNAFLINELRSVQKSLRDNERALNQARDELEVKVAERTFELRKSEQELRLLIETVPAMVWRTTPGGEIDYINQRLADYLGRSVTDLKQQRWREIVHRDDVDTAAREWSRSLETEAPLAAQYRLRRADGVYRWFQIRAEPLRDVDGHVVHWYGVHVDLDDSKRTEAALRATEAQLSRATQVATVAELAASIAHEINQPLAALVANAHACQGWLSAEPPNLERAQVTVDRIIRDGHDAAEIVRRIRALFKRTAPTRTLLDLNEVIAEVSRLMSDELSSKNVTLVTDLEANLPATWVDRVQVQQVIVNLVRNGIEAMDAAESHPKELAIRSRRDGSDGVLIEIQDTGIGLEDAERIFEPFVSTKGHGMGMGLAICRSIVEAHEGRLWATRNSPRGATFSVRLPVGAGASR